MTGYVKQVLDRVNKKYSIIDKRIAKHTAAAAEAVEEANGKLTRIKAKAEAMQDELDNCDSLEEVEEVLSEFLF